VDEDGLPIDRSAAFPSQSEANEPPEPISETRNVGVEEKDRAEVVVVAMEVDDVGEGESSTIAEMVWVGAEAEADEVTGASSTVDDAAGGERGR
jgi:hypothetical protein